MVYSCSLCVADVEDVAAAIAATTKNDLHIHKITAMCEGLVQYDVNIEVLFQAVVQDPVVHSYESISSTFSSASLLPQQAQWHCIEPLPLCSLPFNLLPRPFTPINPSDVPSKVTSHTQGSQLGQMVLWTVAL